LDKNLQSEPISAGGAKPRVAMLITGLGCGGAEAQVVRLSVTLKRRGWDVRIMSMLSPEAPWPELENAGITVTSLKMKRGKFDPLALIRAVVVLRRWKPDILTCFLFHANILGRIAGRIARIPVVISSIRNEWEDTRLRHLLLRWSNLLSDVTTANSKLAATTLLRLKVVSTSRLEVVPNGIVPGAFEVGAGVRAEMRRALGVEDHEFLWAAVGRLEEQKDYPTLLRALSLLAQDGTSQRVVIVGEGSLEVQLKELVTRSGLADRVQFLGLRRDIPSILAAADALVLSSAWEGSPNSVLEALDAGKPVVSTGVGGVAELVQDGESGFIVPPKNPEQLAAAMAKLMALAEKERQQMGLTGREHIRRNHRLEDVVDFWSALYMKLLNEKTGGARFAEGLIESAR
jgi:glycosyltransferase involved in cell wall biosynthesis